MSHESQTATVLNALGARLVLNWHTLDPQTRISVKADLLGAITALPFAIVGAIWLISITDVGIWREHWPLLGALSAFVALLDEVLDFTVILSPESQGLIATSSLSPVIVGSMMFLFGPSTLWITLPQVVVQAARALRQSSSAALRVQVTRNVAQALASNLFAPLCGLAAYVALGGTFPIARLDPRAMALAAVALAVEYGVMCLIGAPFMWYVARALFPVVNVSDRWRAIRNLLVFIALGRVIAFFGVLGSVVYVRVGIGSYVFAATAITAAAFIAHHLSRAVAASASREAAFRMLNALGRAILNAPPDVTMLPALLQRETKGMFVAGRFEARLFPDSRLARDPDDDTWPVVPDEIWARLESSTHFTAHGLSVVGDRHVRRDALVVPICDAEDGALIGGVYLMRNAVYGPIGDMLQTVQAFAEQIASAVLRARSHEQQQAKARAERELVVAGEIQARFLPKALPHMAGFEIAAHLDPARQASGDFYDVAALPDGGLGLTIADVTDKGTGAALFMALSCTLLRTYAPQHPLRPDLALGEVNRRICEDTETDLFVTMLHGVLHAATGEFRYCNAGHTPGLLLRMGGEWATLPNSSMPLGIFNQIPLHTDCVALGSGDVLVLYTDGMTDAQNAQGELFGEARLREVIAGHAHMDALRIREGLLVAAQAWAEGTPQFDDIALIIVKRLSS